MQPLSPPDLFQNFSLAETFKQHLVDYLDLILKKL